MGTARPDRRAHRAGRARPTARHESFVARKGIVIATGASPIQIPGFTIDGEVVITAREAVSLKQVPKTLVLIGGGIIGMELGMVYQKLGTKVIVVEMLPRLLRGIDEDLVQVVERKFKAAGGEVLAQRARPRARRSRAAAPRSRSSTTARRARSSADKVLVAVGFRPNSQRRSVSTDFGVKTDAARPHRGRRSAAHQRAGHLRDRRRHRHAVSRAPRHEARRGRGRGDRRQARLRATGARCRRRSSPIRRSPPSA